MHCASNWPNAATLVESSFMRLTKLISWVLFCGTFALLSSGAYAQSSRIPGRIVVAKATGDVTATVESVPLIPESFNRCAC